MGCYRLGVLEGDGIGPEVVRAAVQVVDAACAAAGGPAIEWVPLPVGLAAYERDGTTLPAATLAALETCDGWLLGPVSTHAYDGGRPEMPNPSAVLRRRFDLYANVRPARSLRGVESRYAGVDLVIVRENTEGFYTDRNVLDGNGELRIDPDTVVSVRVVTRRASLRIAEYAFALAAERARARGATARVTAVHKANVLRHGDGLFLACCREVAARYPEVRFDTAHVDAFAMFLVQRPEAYDVVVTTNLFGDILSDEAAGLVGGLGLAPSLNAGARVAMAQAVHGSAPDLAGRGVANPVAEILSAQMLLAWLGQRHDDEAARAAARRIGGAVERVLAEGRVRTPDLGGRHRTAELTSAIVDALDAPLPAAP
ncbi:MAG TPA: isocitrate/isopropylmalate family dehydrogenase [Thermodesulfobacteriota bacterium]|nr:isocitrate/isopropylmalate family dehydrogenase [Thermodesulfobacteriota bacterium]